MNVARALLLAIGLVAGCLAADEAAEPVEVVLASRGAAAMGITISPDASPRTRQAASDLAAMLGRITGAGFRVAESATGTGITVGTCAEFPPLAARGQFAPEDPFQRDAYLLHSHAGGLDLIGATDIAVVHAVWDLLYRLGYRLYFLTDTWEIVPDLPELRVRLSVFETPDYVTRAAPRGAPWSNGAVWSRWKTRNRVLGAFTLNTGHSYDGIISRHKEVFKAHPEYLALVNGKRGGSKFCIANKDLRQLVVDDAVEQFRKSPERDSISLDPSDGGGWCTCEACQELGSVSDRVVLLANQAAEAVNGLGLGAKYVGIYGYAYHSIPPSIKVHPRVVVSLATSFIRGGYTIDTMVSGWSRQGAVLGIRDYHDVFTWSHDLPRRARGGNIPYLVRTIPSFHERGARFMNSENSDSWAANGLGYWLTPRLLWDLDQADAVDTLFDDFLTKCFGPAKAPMREFYERINFHLHAERTAEDSLARYYRLLDQAMKLAGTEAQRKRLEDLILYVRYIELYYQYRRASTQYPDSASTVEAKEFDGLPGRILTAKLQVTPRQEAYNAVCIHVLRMKDRYMVSTNAIVTNDRYRDGSVVPYSTFAPKAEDAPDPIDLENVVLEEPEVPVDPATLPFTRDEVLRILAAGIEANQPVELDFTPVEFGAELVATVPVKPDAEGRYVLGDNPSRLVARGTRTYLIWLDDPGSLEIEITGGLIAHYRDRGNVKVALYSPQNELGTAVAEDASVPPDGQPHVIVLTTTFSGMHRLEISDGHDKTAVAIPEGVPVTVASGLEDRPSGFPGKQAYFFVPKGTTTVGGFTRTIDGYVVGKDGQRVYTFADLQKPGFFSIPVPPGQDGGYWQFVECGQQRHLMTVPPYMARSPGLLLLPREVVTPAE